MKGTMVNVSVEALLTTTELPYESTLVSNFKDGQVREHNISGTYQETVLANIVVKKVSTFIINFLSRLKWVIFKVVWFNNCD